MNQIAPTVASVFLRVQCSLWTSFRPLVSDMHVVLVGGTAEALLLSYHLAADHTVSIVELEAELGLPVQFPGRVIDKDLLSEYFTDDQISFLMLHSNPDGWGCRWDWIVKHLAANVARKGVQCYTRTRVLSCTSTDAGTVVNLSGSERDLPSHLYADRVIAMRPLEFVGPGRRRHQWTPNPPEQFPEDGLNTWFGGFVLSIDAQTAPSPDLKLVRADNITELWWSTPPSWTPSHGYFEQCELRLPSSVDFLSFDGVISRVRGFLNTFV